MFAFHGYPWLIHRLTYKRNIHPNIHVQGNEEAGAITTSVDVNMLNELRFRCHRPTPSTQNRMACLKQNKLIEHGQGI